MLLLTWIGSTCEHQVCIAPLCCRQWCRCSPPVAFQGISVRRQQLLVGALTLVRHRAAQRPGVQPPRARCTGWRQNTSDLAREAVGWNTLLGAIARPVSAGELDFVER